MGYGFKDSEFRYIETIEKRNEELGNRYSPLSVKCLIGPHPIAFSSILYSIFSFLVSFLYFLFPIFSFPYSQTAKETAPLGDLQTINILTN